MKKRKGLVSNSSTTSFCIYGVRLDDDEDFIKQFKLDEIPIHMWSFLDKKLKDLDIRWWNGEERCWDNTGPIYIGKKLQNMKDDETMAEFKWSVENELRKVIPEWDISSLPLGFYEESYRDG